MKILVLGSGGREHAIIKALKNSPSVTEIHVSPGNSGMSKEALCHNLDWRQPEEIISFCLRTSIDFVFIGPEDPLVAGLTNRLRERGVLVIGPDQESAQLEGSKIYCKHFLQDAEIPTAAFQVVQSVEETLTAASNFTPPYVLKADGLAAGKGVAICQTLADLKSASENYFNKKIFGKAGEKAVLEQFMPGWELSYLIITNGETYQTLPLAQDHKKLHDRNQGPNTGGMGTVAPLAIPQELDQQIRQRIIEPTLKTLKNRGCVYRGILFAGIMVTSSGPSVIEFNVRLGDPETQVILPLIEGDLGQIFFALAKGQILPIHFKNLYSSCVVLAAEGYPDQPKKGAVIKGDLWAANMSSYFIHAGTQKDDQGQWRVNGGRVLGAVGLGSSLQEALDNSYQQVKLANWEGMQYRRDIGHEILEKFKK